jgi:ankyrin repeat protein
MTKLLVNFYKIDCSAIINQRGRNPLHTTISAELVNYFCANGCKINQEDELGRTPLFYACSQDVAKAFLENKADVRHIDHEIIRSMSNRRHAPSTNVADACVLTKKGSTSLIES